MVLRKVALLGGVLSLLVSQAAMSVGLGNIKLNSSLNEPLDAEIQLLNVGELSDLEILVGLAGREDFARAGVAREFFLTDLRFSVDRSSGQPVVRVKSSKPVREPYLDFLVELQWPSGRMLREYTLLVDLPVYVNNGRDDKETVAKKSQPKSVDAATSSSTARRTSPTRRSTQSSGATSRISGNEYNVKSGDTLWGIASDAKPEGASVYQSMVAIKRLNPSAFIDGDVNLLKRGAVLRLPDRDQATATSHRQAVSEVLATAQSSSNDSGALLDASDESSTSSAPAPVHEGRLKLAVADNEASRDTASALGGDDRDQAGASTKGLEALANDLAIAEEENEKKDRIIGEQEERIANLEQQVNTMRRMLEISDSELAGVQAVGGEQLQGEQSALEIAAAGADESAVNDDGLKTDATENSDEVAELDTGLVAQSEAPKPVVQAGFWESYKYYVIGGVGLLVLALFFVARRNRYEYPDELDDDSPDFAGSHIEPVMATTAFSASSDQTMAELKDVDLADEDQLFTSPDSEIASETKSDSAGMSSEEVTHSDNQSDFDRVSEEEDLLSVSESDLLVEEATPAEQNAEDDNNDGAEFDLELDLDDAVTKDKEDLLAATLEDDADAAPVVQDSEDEELDLEYLNSAGEDDSDLEEVEVVTDSSDMPSLVAATSIEDADEFDLLSDEDEVGTKLDLARAYIDMGDSEGAREILQEVMEDGDADQQEQAQKLIADIT